MSRQFVKTLKTDKNDETITTLLPQEAHKYTVFRMARLVRPLWNLAHDDFAPD